MTNLVNIVEFSRVKRLWQRCEQAPERGNVCRKIRVNNYKSQREIPVEEIIYRTLTEEYGDLFILVLIV